jgi:hypothetical protein
MREPNDTLGAVLVVVALVLFGLAAMLLVSPLA